MTNTQRLLHLNRKKLVIKDIEYIIDSKIKEEHCHREESTIPNPISSSLSKWSKSNDRSTFTQSENYADFLQSIENSNRELDEMEEHIEMILVAANNDKNILEECENYIEHKYKVHLLQTSHINFTSIYEYCMELLKNAKVRTNLVKTVPPSLDRITINPNKMNGQPCIRDLRLTVWRVIELLQTYPDRSELYQEFPELTEEDIKQAISYNNINSKDPLNTLVVSNSIAHETFA